MKIEVGKSYTLTPKWKKSVVEVEMYSPINEANGKGLNTEILWRSGTFQVHVEDEDERLALQDLIDDEDAEWCSDDFNNWEMHDCWDGISEDFVFYANWSESEKEEFEAKYEEANEDDWVARYEFLEDLGYQSTECIFYISNGVNIELYENE